MPPKKSRLQKHKPSPLSELGSKNVSVFSDTISDTDIMETNNIMNHYLVQDQDEEYEMAMIMDTIRMQEQEEKQKREMLEKEKQQAIATRDYHIKEILRKLKVNPNNISSFETTLIHKLEELMETEDIVMIINDVELYNFIEHFLGLSDCKGVIRLKDDTKQFAHNFFKCV